jgi:hypothetical protein
LYYRVIIYDETVEWDNQSIGLMEDFSDDLLTWKNTKKEKKLERLLTV